MALDPDVGEPNWLLGQFLWRDLKRADEGAQFMARSAELVEADRFVPRSPLEWVQLAQALARLQRTKELRSLSGAVRSLPTQAISRSALAEIAKLMEGAGLLDERDALMALGRQIPYGASTM